MDTTVPFPVPSEYPSKPLVGFNDEHDYLTQRCIDGAEPFDVEDRSGLLRRCVHSGCASARPSFGDRKFNIEHALASVTTLLPGKAPEPVAEIMTKFCGFHFSSFGTTFSVWYNILGEEGELQRK